MADVRGDHDPQTLSVGTPVDVWNNLQAPLDYNLASGNMSSWNNRLEEGLEDQEGLGLPLAALMLVAVRSREKPGIQLHKCRAVRERVRLATALS